MNMDGVYSFCFPWAHSPGGMTDLSVNKKYNQIHCKNRLMDSGSSKEEKGNYPDYFRLKDPRFAMLKHKAIF